MGRKRRFGITSSKRYKLKMFRVFSAGVPEELAMESATAVTDAFNMSPRNTATPIMAKSIILRRTVWYSIKLNNISITGLL